MKILTALSGTPGTATWTQPPAQQVTIQDRSNGRFPRNIVLSSDGLKIVRPTIQAGISVHELIRVLIGQEPTLTWAPIISAQPSSQSCVHSSTAAVFTVTAASETDIAQTYQWQYNKKAVGALTSDNTNVSAADTVTIGTKVYTFRAFAFATGTLTSDNTNVANNDTVTIENKTYTFKTALTPTEGEVLIGGSADASLLNLIRAINHSGTPDTDYKCAAAHTQVTAATSVTSHAFTVTSILSGTAPNAYATTETSAHLSWGATTLTGGTANSEGDVNIGASADGSLLNLIRAINHSGTVGADYQCAAVNSDVTAATSVTSHAFAVTAITAGTVGNAIASTETSAHLSWGAATLTTGGWTSATGTINGCVYTNDTTASLTCTPTTTGQTGFSHRCVLTSAGGGASNQTTTSEVILTIT